MLAPFIAGLGDRIPRDRVLFLGYLAQTAAYGATWVGMALGAAPVLVILAATCAATALSVTRPAQGSLIPSLSRTPEELTAANGLSGTMEGAGMLVGPLVAAAILAVATPTARVRRSDDRMPHRRDPGRPPPVGRDAGGEADEASRPDEADRSSVLDGLRLAARHGSTRIIVGILALRMVVIGALDVLFILLALEVFDIGESGAGILNAALGLGVVVGGGLTFTFVGRQRLAPVIADRRAGGRARAGRGRPRGVGLERGVLVIVAGGGFAACDIVGRTILQRATPDAVLSRVLGALEGVDFAGLAVGSLLAPLVVLVIGVQPTVIVFGLVLPVGIALAWAGLRAIDRDALVPFRAMALLREAAIFAPLPQPSLEWLARADALDHHRARRRADRRGRPRRRVLRPRVGRARRQPGGPADPDLRSTRADGVGEIALLRDVPRTATVTATRRRSC